MPPTLQYTYSRSADQPYAVEMLPLPEAHKTALLADARAAYRKLFSAMTIAKNGSDATVVAGVSGVTNTKTIMICTTTTVYGTLDEVAKLYVADKSAIVLDFAESKRLYTLEMPSKHAPMRYAGMRWSRWKSPSKLVTDRDLVYVEYMDEFTDPETGRRGWARCTKSVVHPCCPESQHPYGPVRAELFCSGMILRETDAFGVLEVSTLVHIDTQGVPAFIAQKVLNSRKKTAQNVNHVLKLVRQMNGDVHEVFADDAVDDRACRSCNDHVSKWTRARHCRHCDEILCKRCALINYTNSGLPGKTTRMCVDCGSGKKSAAQSSAGAAQTDSSAAALAGSRRNGDFGKPTALTASRHGSSRSIDTESVDSFREDGESALNLLDELNVRESSKQPPLSRSASASASASASTDSSNGPRGIVAREHSRQQQRSHTNLDRHPSLQQQAASNLQRINPRQRGASLLNETPQPRRDAPVDLSYLNDLVSAKAK